MRKTVTIACIIGVIAVLFAVTAIADTQKTVPQTVCPMMGGKIDKSLFVDADGKRIYVCCQGCIDKVKAEPAKYIAQLEKEGITLDKTPIPQTVCPVAGGKIDKNVFVDADGKRIYLCCQGCGTKVKADPAKYIAQLEKEGITLDKTLVPQTVCPVMGGKIDKSLFVDAAGKRIYVCCEGCIDKVKADSAKYISQLEKQGITLDTVPHKDGSETKDSSGTKDGSGTK